MTAAGPRVASWERGSAERVADRYYDATTWIYRRAWGRSFHFAPLRRGETRRAAIRRYELALAAALGVRPGARCLDLGAGVGGPAATIAGATGATVAALNVNRGQLRLARRTVPPAVRLVGGDFAQLPFAAQTFDVVYAFEALCHATDLAAACREVHRVLRPGGSFGFSEWCLTGAFRPADAAHARLRRQIEASYGVARLATWPEWEAALAAAGFTVVATREGGVPVSPVADGADRAPAGPDDVLSAPTDPEGEPWYRALHPRDGTLDSLVRSAPLRGLQAAGLRFAERLGLAPAGTAETVALLRAGTAALVEAGRRGIFTPMRCVLATRA